MSRPTGLDPATKHVLESGEEAVCPDCGRGKAAMLTGCRYCGWTAQQDRLAVLMAYRASLHYQRDQGLDEQSAFLELRKLGDRIAEGEIPDLPVSQIIEGLKRTGDYWLFQQKTTEKRMFYAVFLIGFTLLIAAYHGFLGYLNFQR